MYNSKDIPAGFLRCIHTTKAGTENIKSFWKTPDMMAQRTDFEIPMLSIFLL